jgi:tetratricopeptide (TPR) repeat protein
MDAIAELEERLARYPRERYPVQHATAQFHLGVLLMNGGRADEAERALRAAAELFDPGRLATEHAKALNALGAALRLLGRPHEAAEAFEQAATTLAGRERGAALHNLGLARRDTGALADAAAAFEQARELLVADAVPAQAAAAARELGATLLQQADVAAATSALEEAVELAERLGDATASGAATNALGLAYLAAGRADDAVDAFQRALAAHPRSLRPGEYAMAKANLALAYEYAGDLRRARLAARQALGVPSAAPAVTVQAQSVIERVGRGNGDLLAVLVDEPRDRWPGLVREEVVRWTDAKDKRAELGRWIEMLQATEIDPVDVAEVWLGALLELPPDEMEELVAATREAAATHDFDWLRTTVDAASARFHTPQLLRLRHAFAWS